MYYAVIDTNVLVSALLSSNFYKSAPGKIVSHIMTGEIIPVYNEEILEEYYDVLKRDKFHFPPVLINQLIEEIKKQGIHEFRLTSGELFPDPEDAVFFEIALAHMNQDDTYLITGNLKHFPIKPFVVTPRQMIEIIENGY